jgi:hypothetical protein
MTMDPSQPRTWSAAILFAFTLAGGVLLAHYLNQPIAPRPMSRRVQRVLSSLPSARLGAREDQVDHTMQQPSRRAFEEGAASPTGAAYDLDPRSISPG